MVAIISTITVMAFALGSSLPLVSLSLERWGIGSDVIGLMGALPALSFFLLSPFVPRLAQIFGSGTLLWGALLLCTFSILALAFTKNIAIWFILRLGVGVGTAILFQISETWINQVATESNRGRTLAIYVIFTTAGFAAGPLMINILGSEGNLPFIISSLIVASGGIAFLSVNGHYPKLSGHSRFSVFSFMRTAPLICAAALLVSFFDGSILTLLPLYGVKVGMTAEKAVLMSSVVLAGNIVLQLPIGWLSDRIGRIPVITGCGVIGLVGAMLLPFVITEPIIIWPMLLIWGGAVVGTYTIALVLMGQYFKGAELVTANASAGILWGLGTLIGPASAGYAMEIYEPHGMPVTFIIISAIFVGICLMEFKKPSLRQGV
jgi:MFS family permease